MRTHRILLAALALAAAAPSVLDAQERQVFRYMHRGMLGIVTESVTNTPNPRQRVVVDVAAGSPAEKAGLLKGDTLLSINGLAASQQVMNLPFEPGDTVVLRVRRDGRERDITVVATERPQQFVDAQMSDSILRGVSIIMDRTRLNADSIRLPRFEHRIVAGDSVLSIIMGRDTVRYQRGSPDVVFSRTIPDSMLTALRELHRMPLPLGDSAAQRILRAYNGDALHVFSDSAMLRPFEMIASNTMLGVRAVAGAELNELNPELGEYFGTAQGVLVINARSGTPAERAGLRPGDVITQVNGTAVASIRELRRAIDGAESSQVQLSVLRRGQTVNVTLGGG